ncbi:MULTISPECIES: sensor histidine kinase [Variovorax]|uniref:sensor histidine kinase n=1 Tax=Variovorax TaxID=34072 RepID=UPI0021AD4254|nr:HAMP domain-containing sensor histidine kinase [Variovorax paradoxus]UVH59905.1 HAMP domain-containing histidine kinase [Variovorax paradoxus]
MSSSSFAAGRDSLAGRLTRTLIVWVGGVWLLCVFAVVWYVDREINHNFDNELVEVSHRMFAMAVQELEKLQHPGQEPPREPLIAPKQLFSEDAVIYQIVDLHEHVMLRSAEAPADTFDVPLAAGFANNPTWRIYTVRHPTLGLFFQVADPLDERRRALNRTLFGLIIPLGAVLPLLALVLRNVARTELRVLQDLAGEIEKRSGADLSPIALPGGLPKELRTVGDHVNRLLERLSHSLDVERALAANAAHELRTPLAAARLRLQTALEHDLQRNDVQAALDALRTLSHRTEKLLQLSRAESGASLARTRVDLVQLAGTVAQEFWQDPQNAERLMLKVPDSVVPLALGDVDALAIALRNLVENALRYGGGRVVIEVMAPCTLAVRDTGHGVTPAQLETLRERHVRHSSDRAGYGLGISIVGTIVEKHGAKLELSSPPVGAAHGFEARIVLRPA